MEHSRLSDGSVSLPKSQAISVPVVNADGSSNTKCTPTLATLVKTSKKNKRLESKKKKAKAFLQLVQSKMEDEDHSLTVAQGCSDNLEAPPVKKSRLDNPSERQIRGDGSDQWVESADVGEPWQDTPQQRPPMTDDELAQLRKAVKARQKASMGRPKVYLTLDELIQYRNSNNDEIAVDDRLPPLFMLDLQHLLLFGLLGNVASFKPRWCRLLRVGQVSSVVVIVMDSVSACEYQSYADCFSHLSAATKMTVEMISPCQYGSTVMEDLFQVPVSVSQLKKIHGNVNKKVKKHVAAVMKVPPKFIAVDQSDDKTAVSLHANDSFDRTCILLNPAQLMDEGYPLPVQMNNGLYGEFVFSKDTYAEVTSQSPMFAVDCEMCMTSAKTTELTRISVVNEKLETIYDTLVKPYNKITNYLTRWSGITKQILDPVTVRLENVQQDLQRILPPDAILCGQSLNGDLIALKMFHPYVVDTSIIYNLSGERKFKCSLKRLTAHFLGRSIQDSEEGHSSVEDAQATMELVLLKLSNSLEFGDVILGGVVFPNLDDIKDAPSFKDPAVDSEKSKDVKPQVMQVQDQKPDENVNITMQSDSEDKSSDIREPRENSEISTSSDKTLPNESSKIPSTCDKLLPTEGVNTGSVKLPVHSTSSSLTHVKNLQDIEKDAQRRRAFFKREGHIAVQSFFTLAAENKKTAALVGEKSLASQYQTEEVVALEGNDDRSCQKLARQCMQDKDFTLVSFSAYKDLLAETEQAEEEKEMKVLKKLDRKVHKVMKSTRPNSLVAVVMTGRYDGMAPQSAVTFVTVT